MLKRMMRSIINRHILNRLRRKQGQRTYLCAFWRRRQSFIQIALEFHKIPNCSLLMKGTESWVIRIRARDRFRTFNGGWTELNSAIVDFSSPHCIIPYSLRSNAEHRILVERPLPLIGIGGGEITALFGEVTIIVEDKTAISLPLTIRAFLLPDDSEPLLWGFEGFFTNAVLHCDYPQRQACLTFRA